MTGEEIKEIRSRLCMSQNEFAIEMQVTATMVSLWETNTHKPTQARILRKLKELAAKTCRDGLNTTADH